MRAFIHTLIGLMLLVPALATAQTFQGSIRGAVRDADGGVLPGTTVTLVNEATGVTRTSVTNERGEYVFAGVSPGLYALRVELAGFAPYNREALEMGVATSLVQDVTLSVGGIAESVTVTGETPLIETADASIASAIDKAQLEVLPTPGRNLFIMSVTTPNVVHTGDPVFVRQQDQTNSSLLSLGGGPLRGNNYTVDGVTITDMRNRAVIIPSFEGTEEMKVQINTYDAEMGRTGGAVFNTIHKSGSNNWAGSALYQNRPNFGRSKTFFQEEKDPNAPYNLWGGGVGGPILRDKAFFYFSTEGYINTDLRNDVMIFPTTAMANGDFSAFGRQIYNPFSLDANGNRIPFPNNQIPANLIDPVGQSLAQDLARVGADGGCPPSAQLALQRARHRVSRQHRLPVDDEHQRVGHGQLAALRHLDVLRLGGAGEQVLHGHRGQHAGLRHRLGLALPPRLHPRSQQHPHHRRERRAHPSVRVDVLRRQHEQSVVLLVGGSRPRIPGRLSRSSCSRPVSLYQRARLRRQ